MHLTARREPLLFSLLLPDCEYEFWVGGAQPGGRRGLERGSCQGAMAGEGDEQGRHKEGGRLGLHPRLPFPLSGPLCHSP